MAKFVSRTSLNIYDQNAWDEICKEAKDDEKSVSEFMWSAALKELSRRRIIAQNKDKTQKITNFMLDVPPPSIFDDFDNVIRPYLQRGTIEEMRLASSNSYKTYRLMGFLLGALKEGIITDFARKNTVIDFDIVETGLEYLEMKTGVHLSKGKEIIPKFNEFISEF